MCDVVADKDYSEVGVEGVSHALQMFPKFLEEITHK